MLIIKQFLVSLFSFVVLDFLWLGYVVKSFNLNQLAEIGRLKDGDFDLHYGGALLAYVFMAAAVVFFVQPKFTSQSSILQVLLNGAFMGLIVYGIFDMTNLAILKNYPIPFIIADMAWGSVVFGLVSLITNKLSS